MEDDSIFLKMEDVLISLANGSWPQSLGYWNTTSIRAIGWWQISIYIGHLINSGHTDVQFSFDFAWNIFQKWLKNENLLNCKITQSSKNFVTGKFWDNWPGSPSAWVEIVHTFESTLPYLSILFLYCVLLCGTLS